MNRKDFRPNNNSSSINKKDKDQIKWEREQKEKKHYDKLDKKREKTRSLLIDKPTYESYSGEDLPVYKINGKLYFRDLRLGEYRNINNPNDKQDINIDNSKLETPTEEDKKKLGDYDRSIGKDFPNNHEIYYNNYDYGTKFYPSQKSDIVYNKFKKSYGVRTQDSKGNLVYAMNTNSFTSSFYGHTKKEAMQLRKNLATRKGGKYKTIHQPSQEYQYARKFEK